MEIIARRSLVRKFGPCVDLCDNVCGAERLRLTCGVMIMVCISHLKKLSLFDFKTITLFV